MTAPKLFGESNKLIWCGSGPPQHFLNPLISVTFQRDDSFTRLINPTNTSSWSPIIPPLNLAPWNLPDLTANVKEIEYQRESRVKELELELAAWKQAHTSLLESVERERKAHNVQIASFNRHFASLDFFKVRAFDWSQRDADWS